MGTCRKLTLYNQVRAKWRLLCCCCPSSQAVVVPTVVAATAKPNAAIAGHRQCRCHRLSRCRCNRICCSLRRRPHLATTFTAIVNAAVTAAATASPTQFPSTQPLRAIAIAAATVIWHRRLTPDCTTIVRRLGIISRNSLTQGRRLHRREQWCLGTVCHCPLLSQ